MPKARIAFALIVMAGGFALALKHAYFFGTIDLGLDFRVYQRTVNWPLEMLYHDQGKLPFIYPPTAILLFQPFSVVPAGFWIWSGVSVIAFAAAVGMLCGKRVAALALCSPAAIGGLILGQVSMIVAALLFAGLRLSPFLGGALWGVAATIKPQLMFLAPVALIVRKDWPMLRGMMAGVAATFLISLIAYGPALWLEWIAAIGGFAQTGALGSGVLRSITPAGIAANIGLPSLPFLLAGVAIGAGVVIAAARKLEREQLIGLVAAASLVASPYAYAHDTIILIPACVVLILSGPWWAAVPAAMILVGTPGLTMIGLTIGLIAVALWTLHAGKTEGTGRRFVGASSPRN